MIDTGLDNRGPSWLGDYWAVFLGKNQAKINRNFFGQTGCFLDFGRV